MAKSPSRANGITRCGEKFIAMSKITEPQIRDLWIKPDERVVPDEELGQIQYGARIPLYWKMIFRFRACRGCICCFWRQVDPSNQRQLLNAFGIHETVDDTMNFFAWIRNSISGYDLVDLLRKGGVPEEAIPGEIMRWKRSNAIEYFFGSSQDFQEKLGDHYDGWMSNYMTGHFPGTSE